MPLRTSRARRVVATGLGFAALAATSLAAGGSPAVADGPGYTVTSLHFAVQVGPTHSQACDIVGDVYVPAGASAAHRVPAILTTNGFGGSAADQTPFAQQYAADGYAVLSYSGLGFGGSGCKITLDDPDYDGAAASQLVSYLGGAAGIAFTDAKHTTAAPVLDVVTHDAKDHAGKAQTYDPRVGMWGGSYGGAVQFAAASVDPRIDALNPQITWNDLSYSLGPNNIAQPGAVSTSNPGAVKLTWGLLFSAVGVFDGIQYAQADPSRLIGCPNFATFVCSALVTGGTTGFFQAGDVAKLRHASVTSYLTKVRVPVLLDQGETDTLFNLNEAVATFTALRAQGTPVSMLWREQGHSGGTPSAAGRSYEDARIRTWFDHYLKGSPGATGSGFAYYQDWTGTFAEAASYPVGTAKSYYLSGKQDLQPSTSGVVAGSQTLLTTPGGLPAGISSLDAIGGQLPAGTVPDLPDVNLPGTYASWQTAALTSNADVVGSPGLTLRISAPTAAVSSLLGPAGQVVLVPKIYDVAPDGSASLIKGLVAPIRVSNPAAAFHVTLPVLAHRFATGHRIRLVVSGGDINYRGGLIPSPVTISAGATQVLTLPTVG